MKNFHLKLTLFTFILTVVTSSPALSIDSTVTTTVTTVTSDSNVTVRIKNRPTCKNVTFTEGQFQLTDDLLAVYIEPIDQAFTSRWSVSEDGSKVKVCVPFSTRFMHCQRWLLNEDEFQVDGNTYNLVMPEAERVYEIGDYYLRNGQAVVCVEKGEPRLEDEHLTLAMGVLWAISAVSLIVAGFLCLTVPVPTTYRAVLPFYMLNLFSAYIVLLARCFGPAPDKTTCLAYAVLLQFSMLSTFFWLNVIAFHVWRCVVRVQKGRPTSLNGFLMTVYVCYGWGAPLLITGATFLIEVGELFPGRHVLQPMFQSNCWFGQRFSTLIFFYGPMTAILAMNVLFFIMTVVNLRSATKYVSSLKPDISNRKTIGTALHLVVIMGLCWIMEVLSWAIGGDRRFWYFTDLLNCLQGFFVLLVVIADTRVYTRFGCFHKEDDDDEPVNVTDISAISCEGKPNHSIQKY